MKRESTPRSPIRDAQSSPSKNGLRLAKPKAIKSIRDLKLKIEKLAKAGCNAELALGIETALGLIGSLEAGLRERLKGYRKEVRAWRKSGFGDCPNSWFYIEELQQILSGEGNR